LAGFAVTLFGRFSGVPRGQLFHDDDDVDFVLTNRSLEVGFCSVA
jgi:hypothetical protein